jgi:putative NADH-flavin reductase
MADIVIVGATGNIGAKILDEALMRGHRVTGTTRSAGKLATRERLTVATVQPSDTAALAGVLQRHDAAIFSLRWEVDDIDVIIEAIRESGLRRALFVVGAGSLLRADGRLHFDRMSPPSPSSKPAMLALDRLRKVDDFDWTAISPPASIKPGERTGRFRTGTDTMVVDDAGQGRISREDFAVAHIRRRFTIGY